jgi:hypothetical protein
MTTPIKIASSINPTTVCFKGGLGYMNTGAHLLELVYFSSRLWMRRKWVQVLSNMAILSSHTYLLQL